MKILHLITKGDELAGQFIEVQRTEGTVEIADLSHNHVNYRELLDQIFAADSIQVW